MKRNYKDRKYGSLTLLHEARKGGHGIGATWLAVCDCGNTREVLARKVASGDVVSCGNCDKGLGIQGSGRKVKEGIPKGHREYFSKLLRKHPTAQITARDYTRLLSGRCVGCNTRNIHIEWSGIGEANTSTDLIQICSFCSVERRGRNVVKWLEFIMRVAQSIRLRTNNENG